MTTRDSRAWIGAAFGAWIASLAANPQLVEKMMELDRKALVSAFCQLAAIVAGFMYKSPLPISERGRATYAAKSETVRLPR